LPQSTKEQRGKVMKSVLVLLTLGALAQMVSPPSGSSRKPLTQARLRVEQSIGGVRVGDSLATARRLLPKLNYAVDGQIDLGWRMKIGEGCLLTVRADTASPGNSGTRVETITLERLTDELPAECRSIRTSKGLGLGTNLQDIRKLYGSAIHSAELENEIVFNQDNGRDCLSGGTNVLQSLFVRWSRKVNAVTMIVVDKSIHACDEYRANH
jgi:hypothetical protein